MLGRLDFVKLGVLPSHGVHRPLVEKWVVLAVGDLVEIVTALHYLDIIICRVDKLSLRILRLNIKKRKQRVLRFQRCCLISLSLTQSTMDLGIKYQNRWKKNICELAQMNLMENHRQIIVVMTRILGFSQIFLPKLKKSFLYFTERLCRWRYKQYQKQKSIFCQDTNSSSNPSKVLNLINKSLIPHNQHRPRALPPHHAERNIPRQQENQRGHNEHDNDRSRVDIGVSIINHSYDYDNYDHKVYSIANASSNEYFSGSREIILRHHIILYLGQIKTETNYFKYHQEENSVDCESIVDDIEQNVDDVLDYSGQSKASELRCVFHHQDIVGVVIETLILIALINEALVIEALVIEALVIESLVIESLVLVESRVVMNGLTVMGLRVIDDDRLRLVEVRGLVVGQSSVVCALIEVLVSLHASYVNMVD